jgi:hypothetical protein
MKPRNKTVGVTTITVTVANTSGAFPMCLTLYKPLTFYSLQLYNIPLRRILFLSAPELRILKQREITNLPKATQFLGRTSIPTQAVWLPNRGHALNYFKILPLNFAFPHNSAWNTKLYRVSKCSSVVKCLSSMCKVLDPTPSTNTQKRGRKEREKPESGRKCSYLYLASVSDK